MPASPSLLDRLNTVSPPVQGALLVTASAFLFAWMNIAVRMSAVELHPIQIAFFRNFFALVFILPWLMRVGREGLRTKRMGLHLWRTVIGLLAMYCWFSSVVLVPLAEAVALNFTLPLFATAGAALFLPEKVGLRRWSATFIGFLGMLVILRPGFTEVTAPMALPIVAAVFMAVSVLIVKTLADTENPNAIVLYMNLFMTPLSLIPALFVWRWPSLSVWVALAALGLLATLAHLCLTRAYTKADASAIMPFDYARLPFVAALAYLLYGEVADIWTWTGAGIIAMSAFYIANREAKVARLRKSAQIAGQAPTGRP